ncbi:MAG TPA: cell envelope integrity EipB family protein, partial [Pseudolabrys sp.]|nr:cell envelope integrity EipB family protein [Pseudolabrys sp.]
KRIGDWIVVAAALFSLYLAAILPIHARLAETAMIKHGKFAFLALWGMAILFIVPTLHPTSAAPAVTKILLTPHRAIYDLRLSHSRGTRGIESVRGRILYDFSGNACEGYKLQFRQVSELDSGEGKSTMSDLRSNTWENGSATKFRFNSQNSLDDQPVDSVDGHAERKAKTVSVSLSKPKNKTFAIPPTAVFPTEHMRRIIEAARAGKSLLEFPVFDGSESGDKVYNTLTVIGRAIRPGQKPPNDATATQPILATLTRWPVTISYFEQESAKQQQTGEQTPTYAVSFELYENGISRALRLDYADFSISGEMTSLDIKNSKPCP